MKYEDFVLKIIEIVITEDSMKYDKQYLEDRYLKNECFEVEWTTGGTTGGTCWDTEHESVASEPEPELEELDRFLEVFCPEISFLLYKKLIRDLVKRRDRSDYEYYGNCYEKGIKTIDFRDLFNRLQELKLIKE